MSVPVNQTVEKTSPVTDITKKHHDVFVGIPSTPIPLREFRNCWLASIIILLRVNVIPVGFIWIKRSVTINGHSGVSPCDWKLNDSKALTMEVNGKLLPWNTTKHWKNTNSALITTLEMKYLKYFHWENTSHLGVDTKNTYDEYNK